MNSVTGKPREGMPAWIAGGDFQVYTAISSDSALLSLAVADDVVSALATDCARFTTAAIETIEGIAQQPHFPKSVAWLTIRSYYAAFYAAHAILRVLGVSCTQFESMQTQRVTDVADVFGMASGVRLTGGLYECALDVNSRQLKLARLDGAGGSHIATWKVFLRELRRVIHEVPSAGLPTPVAGLVIGKLSELEFCLTNGGAFPSGSFLSDIRNRVNYRLDFGAWFPYGERRDYYDSLFNSVSHWERDPLAISLSVTRNRELQRVAEAAALLVAIAREMSLELVRRCPRGKSMQTYACESLLNQLAA